MGAYFDRFQLIASPIISQLCRSPVIRTADDCEGVLRLRPAFITQWC